MGQGERKTKINKKRERERERTSHKGAPFLIIRFPIHLYKNHNEELFPGKSVISIT